MLSTLLTTKILSNNLLTKNRVNNNSTPFLTDPLFLLYLTKIPIKLSLKADLSKANKSDSQISTRFLRDLTFLKDLNSLKDLSSLKGLRFLSKNLRLLKDLNSLSKDFSNRSILNNKELSILCFRSDKNWLQEGAEDLLEFKDNLELWMMTTT